MKRLVHRDSLLRNSVHKLQYLEVSKGYSALILADKTSNFVCVW